MRPISVSTRFGLHVVGYVMLALVIVLMMPLLAIVARFLAPTLFAAVVVAFAISCFSPRLRHRLETLGEWQPH